MCHWFRASHLKQIFHHGDPDGDDDRLTFQSEDALLSWRPANWEGVGIFCPGINGVGIHPKIPKLEALPVGKAAGKNPGYCPGLKSPLWRLDGEFGTAVETVGWIVAVDEAGEEEESREVTEEEETWIEGEMGRDFLWSWLR
jgi:hypothetical protein